ncbi:MAG: alpha/beta hydrolase [Bryobacteraceae bacterium]
MRSWILMLAGAAALCAQPAPVGVEHVYKRVGERDLKLYVLAPEKGSGPFPAIVFFHGGGWRGGRPVQFNPHSERLAQRGMVAVQVEYRLLKRDGKVPPEVCVRDAKSAMRWVRAHAAELKIDASRIAAGGGSAGGHLAAFTGMVKGLDDPADDVSVSALPAAMALYNPVFDNGPKGYGYDLIGERYKEFSPFHNIRKGMPPAIVFVGTQDKLLPVETVKAFCEGARAVGTKCEYRVYEGQPHGFFNHRDEGDNRYYKETLGETERFFEALGWIQ